MLNIIKLIVIFAECRFAECHYDECHYAECRCAKWGSTLISPSFGVSVSARIVENVPDTQKVLFEYQKVHKILIML